MTTSLAVALAGRVRQERLRLGWTQPEAAARVGFSRRSYQRFEQSAHITLPRLEQMLAAFGLTLLAIAEAGATLPVPDARATKTRQRGLRHAPPASPPKPASPAGGSTAPKPVSGTKSATKPRQSAPVEAARVAAVGKAQRDRIIMLVRTIVSNHLTNYTSYQVVQNTMNAASNLEEGDRPAFVAAVESQLAGLNAENLPAYGIGSSDFERWEEGWNSDLGIVDVLPSG